MIKRGSIAFLLGVISLGVLFRCLRLGDTSLWLDEIYTLIRVKKPFWDAILQVEDYSAPLYQLMVRLMTFTSFPSEALLRLPAFLAGCLTIGAAWWFSKTLFGRHVAFLVTPVIALSSVFIQYSKDARPYTLFALTSTLSMIFFYRLVNKHGLFNHLGYFACTTLLVYSHFYGFLVILAQVIYLACDWALQHNNDRKPASFLTITAVCFFSLPSAWLALRYIISGGKGVMGGMMPSYGPINVTRVFGDIILEQPDLGGLFLILIIAVIWPGASAFDFRCCTGSKTETAEARSYWKRRAPAILCALWVTISIYPLIAVGYIYRPIFVPRYAIAIIVPLVTLAIVFLLSFSRWIVLLCMAGFLICSVPRIYYEITPATGIKELVKHLNQIARIEEKTYVLYIQDYHSKSPAEMALEYYGYKGEKVVRLVCRIDMKSVQIAQKDDPFPMNERSFIVTLAHGEIVENYLKGHCREYQIRDFGRGAMLFIIE